MLQKLLQDLQVDLLIPDYPLFTNLFLPCFKLGLDQTDQLTRFFQQGPEGRENEAQRNKGNVR